MFIKFPSYRISHYWLSPILLVQHFHHLVQAKYNTHYHNHPNLVHYTIRTNIGAHALGNLFRIILLTQGLLLFQRLGDFFRRRCLYLW